MSHPSLFGLLFTHWQPAWWLDLSSGLYASLYMWATRRIHGGWPAQRSLSFLGGIACVLVALQSGVAAVDDRLLSAHMMQHMLLLLLAPLLLLGGRPALLALRALPARERPALAGALSRLRPATGPVHCLAVFYAVVLLTHLPSFYGAMVAHTALHDSAHLLYLVAGLLLWWPVLDGDPSPSHRLGGLGRLVYVLAAMPAMALVGAYLNRHASLVYPVYGTSTQALGDSPLVDQQQAGAIMWVGGNVVMVAVGLWSAIGALLAEDRRQQARDRRAARPTFVDPAADRGAGA